MQRVSRAGRKQTLLSNSLASRKGARPACRAMACAWQAGSQERQFKCSHECRRRAGAQRFTVNIKSKMQSRAKPQSRGEMQLKSKAINAKGVARGQGAGFVVKLISITQRRKACLPSYGLRVAGRLARKTVQMQSWTGPAR